MKLGDSYVGLKICCAQWGDERVVPDAIVLKGSSPPFVSFSSQLARVHAIYSSAFGSLPDRYLFDRPRLFLFAFINCPFEPVDSSLVRFGSLRSFPPVDTTLPSHTRACPFLQKLYPYIENVNHRAPWEKVSYEWSTAEFICITNKIRGFLVLPNHPMSIQQKETSQLGADR